MLTRAAWDAKRCFVAQRRVSDTEPELDNALRPVRSMDDFLADDGTQVGTSKHREPCLFLGVHAAQTRYR